MDNVEQARRPEGRRKMILAAGTFYSWIGAIAAALIFSWLLIWVLGRFGR